MINFIKKYKITLIMLLCTLITCIFSCIQLKCGSYQITINDIFNSFYQIIFNRNNLSTSSMIIWNIRMPRILVALLVGMNLSISGCIFQTITQNEMASPYTLGISQGCGLVIMLILIFFPHLSNMMPLYAMIGGIISFLIVYLIAYNHGTSPVKLVLAGVILGSITASIQKILFLFLSNIQIIQNATNWTLGSLIGISWSQFNIMIPWTIISLFLVFCFTRPLDMLLLGDNTASSLGMNIQKWRFILSILGILLAASSVSAVGLIGFIGLIVPHISRSLVGASHIKLFKACIFIGPTLVIVADTIARLSFSPLQLPIGVVTGALGGIFFLILMKHKNHMVKL